MSAPLPLLADAAIEPPTLLAGILDVPGKDLLSWLAERGQPPMRAGQIHRQMLANHAESFDAMSDLPKSLRTELGRSFSVFSTRVERHLAAADGTHKLVLRLHDDRMIECVLIQDGGRATACISTQVGCGMGCVFCASGIGGVVRNLSTAEILEQILHARNLLPAHERLTNVVVMGMGEPMANLDALLEALDTACSPDGLGISARHIHISTVGLPARMRRLADAGKQYHLAVSLHAPTDELRNQIVPTNDKVGLAAILDAADYFQATTGRQVTYEYVLLRGVNDRPEDAEGLVRLLRGRQGHINLIPFNDVVGLPYRRLTQDALGEFVDILRSGRLSATVRKRHGADIDAACGQLRREALADRQGSPPAELHSAAGV
jgi:23S rRNA (adenine2503-C2)-methyltransferase